MYKSAPEYGWSFGNCSSSHSWIGFGVYTEMCCIQDKKNVLTCNTANIKGDWSKTILMMLGHRFCDDVVDHSGRLTIDTSGICIMHKIYVVLYITLYQKSPYMRNYIHCHMLTALGTILSSAEQINKNQEHVYPGNNHDSQNYI